MITRTLQVGRRDFAEALKTATVGVRSAKNAWPLRLELRDGLLIISGRGATGSAPAKGDWGAPVLINSWAAKSLHPRLPDGDPLTLAASDGRLVIGRFSMPAELLDDAAPAAVETTLSSGDREVLAAVKRLGLAGARSSFGQAAIDKASYSADRAINAAVRSLAAFGVTKSDVRSLIDVALDRG